MTKTLTLTLIVVLKASYDKAVKDADKEQAESDAAQAILKSMQEATEAAEDAYQKELAEAQEAGLSATAAKMNAEIAADAAADKVVNDVKETHDDIAQEKDKVEKEALALKKLHIKEDMKALKKLHIKEDMKASEDAKLVEAEESYKADKDALAEKKRQIREDLDARPGEDGLVVDPNPSEEGAVYKQYAMAPG